jgi:hypothetical protein
LVFVFLASASQLMETSGVAHTPNLQTINPSPVILDDQNQLVPTPIDQNWSIIPAPPTPVPKVRETITLEFVPAPISLVGTNVLQNAPDQFITPFDYVLEEYKKIYVYVWYSTPFLPQFYNTLAKAKMGEVLFRIRNNDTKPISNIQLKARIQGLTDWVTTSIDSLESGNSGGVLLYLNIPSQNLFDYEEKNYTIEFQVEYTDQEGVQQYFASRPLNVASKNDFMWSYYKSVSYPSTFKNLLHTGVTFNQDYSIFSAAFVTPRIPEIESVINDAKELLPNRAMGFPLNDNELLLSIKATYNILKERGISYVNSPVSFEGGSQSIRLPQDSLKENQGNANCIDGTVLFASLFEKIDLTPLIVLVPGHAYVGVISHDDSTKAYFIETTMLGTHTFEQALQKGMEEFNFDRSMSETKIIDISRARQIGIVPAT